MQKSRTVYAAIILLLLLNSGIISSLILRSDTYDQWLLHTREVQAQIRSTEALLVDAETGQRGFLLTGEAGYLQPYELATSTLDHNLEGLEKLTQDNPNQQRTIAEIRQLAKAKLSELDETVSLAQHGDISQAREIVRSNKGERLMGQLRKSFAEMEKEEARLLEIRNKDSKRASLQLYAAIAFGTLISAILLLLLAQTGVRLLEAQRHIALANSERENWLRTALQSIGDAVVTTDERGNITLANPVAAGVCMLQAEDMVGRPLAETIVIVNEETGERVADPVAQVLQTRKIVGLANHSAIQRPDGSLCPIEDSATPILDANNNLLGMVMVFRDISKERVAQEVLRRSEKLATVGRLSATIAHEINNPLSAVTNLLHLIKNDAGLSPSIREWVLLADEELGRVSHIAKQTLSFYRGNTKREDIALAPLVEQIEGIYRKRLESRGIRTECDLDPTARIFANHSEIVQVISNLLSNSLDVLSDGGVVKIAAKRRVNHTFVSIEDNGPGIPKHLRSRVFEPFFTTKKDVGTGLGLWIVEEITRKFGGSVHLESGTEPGQSFTRFEFVFPTAARSDGAGAA